MILARWGHGLAHPHGSDPVRTDRELEVCGRSGPAGGRGTGEVLLFPDSFCLLVRRKINK